MATETHIGIHYHTVTHKEKVQFQTSPQTTKSHPHLLYTQRRRFFNSILWRLIVSIDMGACMHTCRYWILTRWPIPNFRILNHTGIKSADCWVQYDGNGWHLTAFGTLLVEIVPGHIWAGNGQKSGFNRNSTVMGHGCIDALSSLVWEGAQTTEKNQLWRRNKGWMGASIVVFCMHGRAATQTVFFL